MKQVIQSLLLYTIFIIRRRSLNLRRILTFYQYIWPLFHTKEPAQNITITTFNSFKFNRHIPSDSRPVNTRKMKSFIEYSPDSDFPIENLPFGVFTSAKNNDRHIGVAIGEWILDLHVIAHLFDGPLLNNQQNVFKKDKLNEFMGLTKPHWVEARTTIQKLLDASNPKIQNDNDLRQRAFVKQNEAKMHVPADIGDYTDFYSSLHHATNVGIMFRGKENALFPNWKQLPVGYHGRSSSIVISGTPIHRPYGQTLPVDGADPHFGPSRLMDFELEMAAFVGGPPTQLGERVTASQAGDRIFGFVLMNDWSARDIQKWEYIPLGPFTAKNLGTTISPWIVTVEALTPYVVDNFPQDPRPFAYLRHEDNFNFDIKLEVDIKSEKSAVTTTVCRSNYRYMYWTVKQQLAQQTVTGCNLRPGDLLGSGTISGEASDSYGSMLELAWKGTKPLRLISGEERKFIQDGDTVTLRGYCVDDNGVRIGFGKCEGKLLPAIPFDE